MSKKKACTLLPESGSGVLWVFAGDEGDDAERQVVLEGQPLGVNHGPVVLDPLVTVHVVDDRLALAIQKPVVPHQRPNALLVELELGNPGAKLCAIHVLLDAK